MHRSCWASMIAVVLAPLPAWSQAHACAATFGEAARLLGDPALPQRWVETTMDDGKPLVALLSDRDGSLFLEFTKTRQGLWARGRASVCRAGEGIVAVMDSEAVDVGSTVNWLLRQAFARGAQLRLVRLPNGDLRISGPGWSGQFTAQPRAEDPARR